MTRFEMQSNALPEAFAAKFNSGRHTRFYVFIKETIIRLNNGCIVLQFEFPSEYECEESR
jgi:hypothetical protein